MTRREMQAGQANAIIYILQRLATHDSGQCGRPQQSKLPRIRVLRVGPARRPYSGNFPRSGAVGPGRGQREGGMPHPPAGRGRALPCLNKSKLNSSAKIEPCARWILGHRQAQAVAQTSASAATAAKTRPTRRWHSSVLFVLFYLPRGILRSKNSVSTCSRVTDESVRVPHRAPCRSHTSINLLWPH